MGEVLSENMTISISQLPTGMYFVNFKGVNSAAIKIVKQ
jgi:hypothetical protein